MGALAAFSIVAAIQDWLGLEGYIQHLRDTWIGTVYGGGVATERGYKFATPEKAWQNASEFVERCAEILSERRNAS